jgi:hypothetical protein
MAFLCGTMATGLADKAEKKPVLKTFLDIHRTIPKNLSDEALAADHKKDLAAEKKHPNVHYTKGWYDKDKGVVFCLCEAPTKEECDAVHKEAHDGHGADEIFEVRATP